MKELEVIIGFALLLIGAVPVGSVLLSGKLPPPTTFGPAGLTAEDEGRGSRVEAQFYHFWFVISFFFFGIGAWFVIAGLNDKGIISKTKTKPN
jgi:hypothetical protein